MRGWGGAARPRCSHFPKGTKGRLPVNGALLRADEALGGRWWLSGPQQHGQSIFHAAGTEQELLGVSEAEPGARGAACGVGVCETPLSALLHAAPCRRSLLRRSALMVIEHSQSFA